MKSLVTNSIIDEGFDHSFSYHLKEALINGKKVVYHVCDGKSTSVEEAKKRYANYKYIGKSNIYFIDGTRNRENKPIYFFQFN